LINGFFFKFFFYSTKSNLSIIYIYTKQIEIIIIYSPKFNNLGNISKSIHNTIFIIGIFFVNLGLSHPLLKFDSDP